MIKWKGENSDKNSIESMSVKESEVVPATIDISADNTNNHNRNSESSLFTSETPRKRNTNKCMRKHIETGATPIIDINNKIKKRKLSQYSEHKLDGKGIIIVSSIEATQNPLTVYQVLQALQILKNGYKGSMFSNGFDRNRYRNMNVQKSRSSMNVKHTPIRSQSRNFNNRYNTNSIHPPVSIYPSNLQQRIPISPIIVGSRPPFRYERVRGSNYGMYQSQFRYSPHSKIQSNYFAITEPPRLRALPSADSGSSWDAVSTIGVPNNSHVQYQFDQKVDCQIPMQKEKDYEINSFDGRSIFQELSFPFDTNNDINDIIAQRNSDSFSLF